MTTPRMMSPATEEAVIKMAAVVEPGDALVLMYEDLTEQEYYEASTRIKEIMPAEVNVIVLAGADTMAVIKAKRRGA